ncbi:MAG: nuclear transport factor 2 family protein [Myxococcota bacterium]
MTDAQTLIATVLEALNQNDFDTFYGHLSEDFRYVTPLYTVTGKDATIEADRPLFAQLSHHWRQIDRSLASGDKVAIWMRFGGTVAHNAKTFEVEVCNIFTVDGETITALELHADFSSMMAAMQA